MVFKMICAFAAMAQPISVSGSRDDAQPLYWLSSTQRTHNALRTGILNTSSFGIHQNLAVISYSR
jgi:hypothetical protein